MKVNPKALAILILTGYLADVHMIVAVRIEMAKFNALGFIFIL